MGITAMAAGYSYTILLDENGDVWTAGYNYDGQLGRDENIGTENANPTFEQSPVNPDAVAFDELSNIPIIFNSVWFVKFKDIQVPVITGLENGKTYCGAVEFETSDNGGIASVKAGDNELTATNGKYTLEKGIGTVTVVTTDNTGNTAEVTVTVNNGHTGGEATCISKAVCDYCGEEYGEVDGTNHNLEKIPAKAATVTETGNKEYWHCPDCGKYFADEKGTSEIKLDDTVTQKLSPEIIDGKGQSITAGDITELIFRSNAAYSDFIRAQLDGTTLDKRNYTVKEGSTVVTLKAEFVGSLSVGEHKIGIVSESGTAEATFTVNAKPAASPQTGDISHMAFWTLLLIVSGGAVVGTAAINKKKKHRKS